MANNIVQARSVRVGPFVPKDGVKTFPEPPAVPLSEQRQALVGELREWLVEAGRTGQPMTAILETVSARLRSAGMPVERSLIVFETLHAEWSGIAAYWTEAEGAIERTLPYGRRADEIYAASPFAYAHQKKSWVILWPAETPDDAFGIVPDLKAQGYIHYVCIPIRFANNTENGLTLATRRPEGFSEEDFALVAALLPTLATIMELDMSRRTLDEVLRAYVGDEPRRRILAGEVRRGQVTRIRSAILFADMRGFTALSMTMPEEALADLLNAYYDCLVPAIEAEGGEVLKYVGDGILAIFRDRSDDFGGASVSALAAAKVALSAIEALNAAGAAPARIEAGIALHHGRAAYGNIGSGNRLDFTVIGRDVNVANRIGRLCAQLGRRLLVSRAFAEQLFEPMDEVGSFELPGVSEPQRIFAVPGI